MSTLPIPQWITTIAQEEGYRMTSLFTFAQRQSYIQRLAQAIADAHHRATQVLTCIACGEAYPPGTPASQHDLLSAHIRVCAKHPMRGVEAQLRATEAVREQYQRDLQHHFTGREAAEASRAQLTYALRSLIHTLETIDADERSAAREEGRSAHVHTSAIKQAKDTLAEHGIDS